MNTMRVFKSIKGQGL